MTDQKALLRVLRHFARTMASSYDVSHSLYDLSDSLVEVLGATAAGVAILDEGGDLRFITATSDQAAAAERVQEEIQAGPCAEAVERGEPVPVPDLGDCRHHWPKYASAVEDIGFRAALGIPLVLDDRRIGSLDVYSVEPREWTDEAIDAALVLADLGTAYVLNASELAQSQRTAEQLQTALDSRVVIEQAKGMLAERVGISPDEAFQRLRSSARSHNTKLVDVCQKVIQTDYVPE